MPESVCLSMILGNAPGRSFSPSSNSSWCICFTDRDRTLNQEMLDLKRLYWNTRVFRGGKRKGRCPYEHLGLALPHYDFWGLLQAELTPAPGQAPAEAPGVAA
jgi:hypothetical protein